MRGIKFFVIMTFLIAAFCYVNFDGIEVNAAVVLITDVNADGTVDIKDLAAVAKAFNTRSGDLNWKSQLDVNKDNTVDVYDLVLVSKNIVRAGNLSNNINNLGFAATDGQCMYYISNYDGYLYKKDINGSAVTLVTKDSVSYINVLDNHIYYRNDTDNGKLYSINIDGTGRSKLSDDVVSFVYVVGRYIYYYSDSGIIGLYRINIDGTSKTKISQLTENNPAQDVVIDSGWIYYTEQGVNNIYKMKIDGTSKTKLNSNISSGLVKNGDWLYYINSSDSYKLYKLSIDGTSNVKVTDDTVLGLGSLGDWIYYAYCADINNPTIGGRLYKIKNDGSSKTLLTEDSPWIINVVGDWVYYSSFAYGGDMYKVKTDGTSHGPVDDTPPVGVVINSIGTTNGNAVNEGISTIQGDWIFYSDRSGLYKMKTDGTQKTNLFEIPVRDINVVGNWVYFSPTSFDYLPSGIYKMRTDGSYLVRLNEDDAKNIIVQGEWIYYFNFSERNSIYKVKTDGSQRTCLVNDVYVNKFNVVGDIIYYTSMDSSSMPLYKIKTDGTSKVQVLKQAGIFVNIIGEWGYYFSDRLYKTKLDGSSTVTLSTYGGLGTNVVGEWIYLADNSGIYKMRTDGTGKTLLTNSETVNINIIGNWLIYKGLSTGYIQFIKLN